MAKPKAKVAIAECPECGTSIRFHKALRAGQIVNCPECDETLQVMSTNPLELDWAYEEVEESDDYDDYDDYDDEDFDD